MQCMHILKDVGSVLAKIHMVTKLFIIIFTPPKSSVLAKIHMVTKLIGHILIFHFCSVLAKIHMVTKRWYGYDD